jgi:hypothetical protein
MKILTIIATISFLLLSPSASFGGEVNNESQKQASIVIQQAWKEATEGRWKYTKDDVNITKQVLVTLVKGVKFMDMETQKPLYKEITKLPFVTYAGEAK